MHIEVVDERNMLSQGRQRVRVDYAALAEKMFGDKVDEDAGDECAWRGEESGGERYKKRRSFQLAAADISCTFDSPLESKLRTRKRKA